MNACTRQQHGRDGRRGAALIVAIAIMTILLAIALTFFAVTRLELKTATNVTNTVRVEFIADAGVALAVHSLNQDFLVNAKVTSTDHPWRSVYSGAAFAGKPWTWRKGAPLWAGKRPGWPGPPGVPEINLNRFPYIDLAGAADGGPDGIPDEPLYRGPRTRNWLFIPRVEKVTDATLNPEGKFTPVLYDDSLARYNRRAALMTADGVRVELDDPDSPYRFVRYEEGPDYFPFVTPNFYGQVRMPDGSGFFPIPWREDLANNPELADLPNEFKSTLDGLVYAKEQVDLWADVDNDGDGLKDSIWIPIPIDKYYPDDSLDNDLDGLIDERQDNAFDDDGDGVVDGSGAGELYTPDPDESIEAGVFAYYTGDDGLDNDGDGHIDRDDSPANPAATPPFEFDPVYDPLNLPPTAVAPSHQDSKLGFMLTTPLPGLRIPVDMDADGVVGDDDDLIPVPDPADPTQFKWAPAFVVLPPQMPVQLRFADNSYITLMMSEADVDTIDNDHDLLVNNYSVYAYLTGWPMPAWRAVNHWEYVVERNKELCAGEPDPAACEAQRLIDWFGPGASVKWFEDHAAAVGLSYNEICTPYYFPSLYELNPFPDVLLPEPFTEATQRLRITMTGEPACDLAGRAAILITDEQSKVNVNVAGAHTYNPQMPDSPETQGDLYRAIGDGVTPFEYETRMLPNIGHGLSARLWGLLTGAPDGEAVPATRATGNYLGGGDDVLEETRQLRSPSDDANYFFDVSFPGYGRVDDNANALLIGLNGLNDNGAYLLDNDGMPKSSLADEGLYLPPLSTFAEEYLRGYLSAADLGIFGTEVESELQDGFQPYFARLGAFEGIDEPAELQRFRPLRNPLAERDGNDNNADTVIDELGELGDINLRTREQVIFADGIGDARAEALRNHVSVHATDRNVAYLEASSSIKTLNKLDFNVATPQQIAAALLLFGDFTLTQQRAEYFTNEVEITDSVVRSDTQRIAAGFAAGLVQADTEVLAPEWGETRFTGGLLYAFVDDDRDNATPDSLLPMTNAELDHRIPADQVLAALQTAVDIVDNRDRDHARSVLTTEKTDYIERPRERETRLLEKQLLEAAEEQNEPLPLLTEYRYPPTPPLDPTDPSDPTYLGPREITPVNELMHLESVQLYAEEDLELKTEKNLEIKDEWWAEYVTYQPPKGGPALPEERRISYTVSGLEAIRINEIMVRPVRRVEAEATPDAANFAGYSPLLDPTPFTESLDGFPLDAPSVSELPEFIMLRGDMSDSGFTLGWMRLPPDAPGAPAVIGAGTGWYTDLQYTTNQVVLAPNVMEYLFVASEGLPEGRYYLTAHLKLDTLRIEQADAEQRVRYSIKYVPVEFTVDETGRWTGKLEVSPGGTTIIGDVAYISGSVPTGPFITPEDQQMWWRQWQEVGQTGFLGEPLPSLFAKVTAAEMGFGEQGKPEGWVFLDGSNVPYDSVPSGNRGRGYFERGIAEQGLDRSDGRLSALAAPFDVLEPLTRKLVFPRSETHTVLVPPPPQPPVIDPETGNIITPARPGWALCVALMLDLDTGNEGRFLPVNFFDFSQEPDHEWIELANVSDQPVDISGWQLEIGIPDVEDVVADPFKTVLTVPPGSVIAPKGMVLLAPAPPGGGVNNKFDYFQQSNISTLPLPLRNGIGLTCGVIPGAQPFFLANVTVPPFADVTRGALDEAFGAFPPEQLLADPAFDPARSVFDRLYSKYIDPLAPLDPNVFIPYVVYSPRDYVDRDSDGLNDVPFDFDAGGNPSQLHYHGRAAQTEAMLRASRDDTVLAGPDKAWDRIIPVASSALDISGAEGIAQLVLQGGIFPNYPEWDGIDNDGDGPYLTPDGVTLRGILGEEMVDNDLDGRIDELDEGIDEGRGVRAGSYRPGTLPLVFFRLGGLLYDNAMLLLGNQGLDATPGGPFFPDGFVLRFGYGEDASQISAATPYVGSDLDPPVWKAFVQRRWYPGDNVIVTLYEGPATSGRVADRVTYNEQDIINRTIDDVRGCPYWADANGDGAFSTAGGDIWYGLNPAYPTLWQENHMGLDFYKSLERKHPLYHGDRFGTSNRWQATDGNYDDWAESLVPWERLVNKEAWPYGLLTAFEDGIDGATAHRYRFDGARPEDERLFRHAMSGTPLRMNTAARYFENPPLPDGAPQFAQSEAFPLPWIDNRAETPNHGWGLRKAEVRDAPFASLGDLMRVPRMSFQLPLFDPHAGARVEPPYPYLDVAWVTGTGAVNELARVMESDGTVLDARQDTTLRTAVLGQAGEASDTETLFLEAQAAFAPQPLVLTVGQADFHPIRPQEAELGLVGYGGQYPFFYQWMPVGQSIRAPRAWAPVYLFEIKPDQVDEVDITLSDAVVLSRSPVTYAANVGGMSLILPQLPALFNSYNLLMTENGRNWPVFDGGYRAAYFATRWPLRNRIVAYVASMADPTGAAEGREHYLYPEAIFEWGPEDGLENGEYTLYIGTFLPGLRNAIVRAADLAANADPARMTAMELGVPPWLGASLLADTYLIDEDGQPTGSAFQVAALLPDPPADGLAIRPEGEDWSFEIEAYTSRTETGASMPGPDAWGKNPNTSPTHPDERLRFCPDNSGYIFYGDANRWQPYIVEVRDNYLALRIRSLSPPGKPVMFTHVVLAPRRSTPGRINVNTADVTLQARDAGGRSDLISPLMGMPGLVDAANPVMRALLSAIPNAVNESNVDPPSWTLSSGQAWPPPTVIANEGTPDVDVPRVLTVPPYRNTPLAVSDPDLNPYTRVTDFPGGGYWIRTASLQLTGLLLEGLPEHADGRYYSTPGELVLDRNVFAHPAPAPDDRLDIQIYPLSNEDNPEVRFDQVQERFRRMANMLTTRSDIFEIIVTAQSGYGLDLDNDGFINYRSDDEFVTTAESKVRTVYIRRSPRPVPEPPVAP